MQSLPSQHVAPQKMSNTRQHNTTQTARLVLRAPTDADLDALFDIYSNPATQRFNPMGAMNSRDAASHMMWRWQLHWMRHGFGIWAIALRDEPQTVIGFGGVAWRESKAGDHLALHVHLRADMAGVGLATEVGDAALALAECHAPFEPVCASVVPTHHAAIGVLRKLGFRAAGEVQELPWLPAKTLYLADTVRAQPVAEATRDFRAAGKQLASQTTATPVAANCSDLAVLLAR
jgi:RimJ/RimL family protein N-acetyltransferase